jgi:hypothetical protein
MNEQNSRGQAAIEVLAYASFFLLVFVSITAVFLQAQNQEMTRAENAYAQQIAYAFADQVHTAAIAGPGFSQQVAIPPDLLGKPYTLRISSPQVAQQANITESAFVYVEWQGQGNPESFPSPLSFNNFAAVESLPFISYLAPQQPNYVGFITIDSTSGSVSMANTYDSSGNQVIIIGKGSP